MIIVYKAMSPRRRQRDGVGAHLDSNLVGRHERLRCRGRGREPKVGKQCVRRLLDGVSSPCSATTRRHAQPVHRPPAFRSAL